MLVMGLTACEKTSEWGFRNGETVNLTVGPHQGSTDDRLIVTKTKESTDMKLHDFPRIPGYTYNVRAKFVILDNPPMDGSCCHFKFVKVLKKTKYNGNDVFKIQLIRSTLPDGDAILINKTEDGVFQFSYPSITLIPTDDIIKGKLEEMNVEAARVAAAFKQVLQSIDPIDVSDPKFNTILKWKHIIATVRHDPNNFGSAYIVEDISFTNR